MLTVNCNIEVGLNGCAVTEGNGALVGGGVDQAVSRRDC